MDYKTPRLDVKIATAGAIVDLESQLTRTPIGERMLFYGAGLLSQGLDRGMDYQDMKRVVVIMLYDGPDEFFSGDRYLYRSKFVWDGPELAVSDRLALVLVEMNKFRREHAQLTSDILGDELESFLYYMVKGYKDREERHEMETMYESLIAYAKAYDLALDDPETAKAYWRDFTAEADYVSRMNMARREGLAEGEALGKAEGRAEERESLLERMRQQGYTPEQIDALLA